jgi:hypothetical protein
VIRCGASVCCIHTANDEGLASRASPWVKGTFRGVKIAPRSVLHFYILVIELCVRNWKVPHKLHSITEQN